jgi:Co/Zn/Cd efflux system component
MVDCCNDKACEIEALHNRQSLTLKIVPGINVFMFVVELTAGLIGGSVSLLADSLDCLAMPWYMASVSMLSRAAQE